MLSIEEVNKILDEVASELPQDFFKDLNGGIILNEGYKMHPESINGDLYIMGQYQYTTSMGRYIVIYYGSFEKVYANAGKAVLKEKLRSVLLHEFRHHLESLAGEDDLEVQDKIDLAKYKQKHNK
ncbi:MAG: metallopeptidase family protein [Christensenellaceae bacterium]